MKLLDGEKKKSASGVKTEGEGEAKIRKIGILATLLYKVSSVKFFLEVNYMESLVLRLVLPSF